MTELVSVPQRNSLWGLFNDFDGLFDDFVRPVRPSAARGQSLIPAIDVSENENEYRVKAELPGVNKDDLDISIQDGVLTINAQTRFDREEKQEGRVIRQERRYGKYVRSMRLGSDIDVDSVKADYRDGVLDLRLPKLEAVKPRKIDVTVN